MVDFFSFISEVEKIVTEEVHDNYPIDWDEDYITRRILHKLRQLNIKRINLGSFKDYLYYFPVFLLAWEKINEIEINIKWNAYKLQGKNEIKFGDIAVLVLVQYSDGDLIEGVAFIEAKKRNYKKKTFSTINSKQLKRILCYAPRASLLLYDYEPIQFYQPLGLWQWEKTFAISVPMDLVFATKKKGTSLYKFSKPFSLQLLHFILGFELERSQMALQVGKGLDERYGIPRYLLTIQVGVDSDVPNDEWVQFNHDSFIELIEDDF